MLVVIDLYMNKTRIQPLLSQAKPAQRLVCTQWWNKFQRFNAINIKTRSTKHMICAKQDGPDQILSIYEGCHLGRFIQAFGLSPHFVTTNVKRKERKIRQTYIAKKTSRKCMDPLWLVHYMHMPYTGPLQSTRRLWAKFAMRSIFLVYNQVPISA